MEQPDQATTTTPTGSFADFRADLLAELEEMKQKSLEIDNPTAQVVLTYLDELERLEAEIHQIECQQVDKQLGQILPQMICKIYNQGVAERTAWKAQELTRLEEMRKNGVSYHERMKTVNSARLERIIANDTGEITVNQVKMLPTAEWLYPISGYDRLKELGVTEFVNRNYFLMFTKI